MKCRYTCIFFILLLGTLMLLSCGSEAQPLPEDPKDWEGLPCDENTPAFGCAGLKSVMICYKGRYIRSFCAEAYSAGLCWHGEFCEPEVGCTMRARSAGTLCYQGACAEGGRCLTREEWEGEPCEEPHAFCFGLDMIGGSPAYAARCNVEEKQYEVLTCTESYNNCTTINCHDPDQVCGITNLEAGSPCAVVDHGNVVPLKCDENGRCGGIGSD